MQAALYTLHYIHSTHDHSIHFTLSNTDPIHTFVHFPDLLMLKLIAYGMCPPVELMLYYQMDPTTQPTHFMRGTATEVWGDDVFKIMHTTAADWDSLHNDDCP